MFVGETWFNLSQLRFPVSAKSETYNVSSDDSILVFNTTENVAANLPSASGSGRLLILKNVNTGILTVEGDDSDTIDGTLNQSVTTNESLMIIDYTLNAWVIM